MNPQIFFGPKKLKVLLCPQEESLTTSVVFLVKAGTDYETKKLNGISHFIEHLYFKGSKNFPSPKVLMQSIDKIGGTFNAFTSHEYTGFYIKILPEYIEEAINILSDIILFPIFPEEEIKKEKKVILEEINLNQDLPSQLVVDLGISLTFGDQPAGWSILGSKKNIINIKRKDIINYVKLNYSSRNSLLIICGKVFNKNKILKVINQKFAHYNSKAVKPAIRFKKQKPKIEEKIYYRPEANQAHMFLSFPMEGFLALKDERYSLGIISAILGEKASSRLWLRIREDLGAAYYIRSAFWDYSNRSLLSVHAGLDFKRFDFLIEEILREIYKLKKEKIEKEEIENSKIVLKSSLLMSLEDSLAVSLFYGKQLLLEKNFLTIKEAVKKINILTHNDIIEAIKKYLKFNNIKLAAILPSKTKIKLSSILKKVIK